MRHAGIAVTALVVGSFCSFTNYLTVTSALAASPHAQVHSSKTNVAAQHAATTHRSDHGKIASRSRHVARGGGISCVPFARRDSGIELVGNAWQWWGNAEGQYARGRVPETGSILAFRSNPHMRLGHVAVVRRVINAREIEIDHANWTTVGRRGVITRGIPVVDVSEANNWTAVRVGVGDSGKFGSVYPTYGFIYDRADPGTMVAVAHPPTPTPELNPAPRDLRPVAERPWQVQIYDEVAEAPLGPSRQTATDQAERGGRLVVLDRK